MDPHSYYLERLQKASALPAEERGADVAGFLRHQRLLDESCRFWVEDFSIDITPAMLSTPSFGLDDALNEEAAPALALLIEAAVACPLDSYSLFKKELLIPPTLSIACSPYVILYDEDGGGMTAQAFDAALRPDLYSVLKATVAAILLRSAAIKEQGQMLAMMPYVHQLATGLVELLEQPAAARQLRASLQRLRMPGAIGEEQAALPYEHLLFACYLLRWQATLALLFTPELPTPDGGREAAMRTNLQAGQRMAQLLPDSPMGHYITSSAQSGLGNAREAWRELQLCKEVAQARGDTLMQGIATVKSIAAMRQGGCGNSSFTLQQISDMYKEARAFERRFKKWCPTTLMALYYTTARGIQEVLAKARQGGMSLQEEFETEVGGLLQRSSAQQDQHYRELVSQSCCTFCRKVSVGLKQCSACKTAQYCSRECQVRHWRAGHRQECGASAR